MESVVVRICQCGGRGQRQQITSSLQTPSMETTIACQRHACSRSGTTRALPCMGECSSYCLECGSSQQPMAAKLYAIASFATTSPDVALKTNHDALTVCSSGREPVTVTGANRSEPEGPVIEGDSRRSERSRALAAGARGLGPGPPGPRVPAH